MIADFVNNREVKDFSEQIQSGIRLHRGIDTFTDAHPVVHQAKKFFSPKVRLYAGAFVDVSFDYFLANDTQIKTREEWKNHSQEVYVVLEKYKSVLPDRFHLVLERMKKDDWLYNYRHEWGIEFSFRNVVNKTQYLDKGTDVFPIFMENKEELKRYYDVFFPEIQEFCKKYQKNIQPF
jgi:possible [acyl-carrier-protein] phosphodiesterase